MESKLVDMLLLEMEVRGLAEQTWCRTTPCAVAALPGAAPAPSVGFPTGRVRPGATRCAACDPGLAQRNEERYQALVAGSADGIWCAEIDEPVPTSLDVNAQVDRMLAAGYISEANPALARMLSADAPVDLIGVDMQTILAAGAADVRELLVQFVASGYRLVEYEPSPTDEDPGTRHTMVGILQGGALTRVWGVRRDTSDMRQLQARLRQAQKMETLGQLTGGVAHDFNNMLTAIVGYSELVLDGLGAAHPLSQDVNQVLTAARRASELTAQLLAFSRKETVRPDVRDLNAVVREFLPMLGRLIGPQIRIEDELHAQPALVAADRSQLEQIVLNLAVNARDAMPAGGSLLLGTSRVELVEPPGHSSQSFHPGEFVCLTVSDTGAGMTEELCERIFEPFFTTKGKRGTGLGLSTVFSIVEERGGTIDVRSAPAAGTTFRVYLPTAREQSAAIGAEKKGAAA